MELVTEATHAAAAVEPSAAELRLAYRIGARSRVLESQIVRLAMRGEVKFAIYGTGEEVHGAASALAFQAAANPERFAIAPHYRSCAMISMWAELLGYEGFPADVLRQQFSRDTDRMTRGRQMVEHLCVPEIGVLPVQSPVGMQLGKSAGYALGFQKRGIEDSLTVAIVGDGTTAEGDMHDAMNAGSVWSLPLLIIVTDNAIAISTKPEEGRGIRDFAAYAQSFGFRPFSCDGRDFFDTYRKTLEAARYVRSEQRPALIHAHSLPRFNGHSSAADMTFDLSQEDPLLRFGEELVRRGLLEARQVFRRRTDSASREFFQLHDLGEIMEAENEAVRQTLDSVRTEPEPSPDTITDFVYPPFPAVEEQSPPPGGPATNVAYGAAIRAALDRIVAERGGVVYGQDVARLGGVMQATAGLLGKHPSRVFDAPLNEPLIVGTAMGAGLHPGLCVMPEIQFGDYSLNAFHWLVYLGNLYWTTAGTVSSHVILRMPVDPFGGGAVYHSMSIDGYFTPIPGLVVVMPSTSWDVYGLLLTAADYAGPVVVLEPKALYRQSFGPAFPGEPTDPEQITALKKASMRGAIPELPPDIRVPFGKGAIRRRGDDLTIVAWGRAVYTTLSAAETLAARGVQAEVIDLRTLVPPDFDLVASSVSRTGRLVVAAEDRPFAGFVRSVQGHLVERFPGIPTRAIGQKNVPGIAQNVNLEAATVLTKEDVLRAAGEVLSDREQGTARGRAERGAAGWAWIPRRYYS